MRPRLVSFLGERMHKFSEAALSGAPWSVSKADTAIKCPLKYTYQYVEKLKLTGAQAANLDDTALRVGSAAHEYAEACAKGRPKTMALRQAIKKNKLLSEEKEKLEYLIPGIEEFLTRVEAFKTNQGISDDLVEGDFGITAEGAPTGFWDDDVFFRWKVDRQLVSATGKTAAIIDLKTGKSTSLRWSQNQLDAYAYGAFCAYPELERVRCGLFSAMDGDFIWAPEYRRDTMDDNPTPAFLEEAAEASTSTEAKPGKHCNWCPYQNVCPAKQ